MILLEALSRFDVGVLGAMCLTPQQSVAVGEARRWLLSEPFTAVLHRVIVARHQRQVTLTQTLDVVDAVGVVGTELGPVAMSQALGRQSVHVTRVDAAQKRRHCCDLVLWQKPATCVKFHSEYTVRPSLQPLQHHEY